MSTIPLGVKLDTPVLRRDVVTRPRLLNRLDQGSFASLILVSAPAGFGKTTLIYDWLRTVEVPFVWLTLDEADNDPAHFLTNLVVGLQKINADVGHAVLSTLGSPQRPPLDTLMIGLINEISAWPGRFLLLLDDYHTVEAQPIHDLLTFLLDHMPAHMHIVILSRADPPLPLSRLRGRGQLAELREAELRFNRAEIDALLNQQMGLALSDAQITAVNRRTEGWITGLHLLALSAQGREDIADFVERFTGSHRYIVDYLTDEVLNRQPEAIQRFLLQTSILTRLSGPLCDAVCFSPQRDGPNDAIDPGPGSRGQDLLETLDAANLFVVPLDDERQWYRYHRLFADVLRHRLRQALPHQWRELHLRAARWYEQNGFGREAVDHALLAEAHAEAARLVEINAFPALKWGELTTVMGWIERLPKEIVHERPMLAVYRAWALLLTGQVSRIEPSLQAVDSLLYRGGDRLSDEKPAPAMKIAIDEIEGHLSAIRCYVVAVSGDPTKAMALGQQALALLPEESDDVRSIVTFVMGGLAMMRGDMASAGAAFADAGERGRTSGNINLAAPAMRALGDIQVMQGRLHQAAETFRDALELATTPRGRLLPVAAGALRGLGELFYEWNDLDAADHHLEQSLELAQQWGQVDSVVGTHVASARLRQTQGKYDEAQRLLQAAEQALRRRTSTPMVGGALAAQQMRFCLAQGDLAAATRWAQERGLDAGEEVSFAREVELVALARVLMAQEEWQTAQGLLTRLSAAAEVGGRTTQVIEARILQALTFQAQNESAQAIARLETALSLAEPEGYVRTFVDEGEPLADLLFRIKTRSESRRLKDYAVKLLAVMGKNEEGVPTTIGSQPLIEPLSDRELEVLRLIAGGLSNHEIAEKLVIAVGTVKAHTASIYGKLAVHSRTRAVARARELELL